MFTKWIADILNNNNISGLCFSSLCWLTFLYYLNYIEKYIILWRVVIFSYILLLIFKKIYLFYLKADWESAAFPCTLAGGWFRCGAAQTVTEPSSIGCGITSGSLTFCATKQASVLSFGGISGLFFTGYSVL